MVDHGMNQILLTQVEHLVKEIEEVEVIDQVLEPLVVVVEQVVGLAPGHGARLRTTEKASRQRQRQRVRRRPLPELRRRPLLD